jgi:cysteine-rich repeat protein
MGGLAQGSGRRNESYDLSIVGGLFSLSEPISIIAFMVGFQGSFDLVTFSLESSVKVINQTHMRLAFSADDNNIYTNASAYIIAFLNNITCYADVGHLYGYQYNQINSIVNVTLPTTFFIGLCRFAVNDSRLNIMLTSDDMNINSGSNYWNLTYSYIYFRLDILCGGDPCPCYDGYHQDSNGVCQEVCQDGRSYELPCDDGNSINGDGCSDTCQVEQYYYCYNTGGRSASFCYFVGPLSLTYSDATKLAGSNKANVTFSVTPAYNDMGSIPWQNILSASNIFSIESVSYSDGTLSVIGSYTSNMSVQTSTVFISTPPSGNYQYIIPSNLSFKATYNDHGFPVLLFTTDQYSFGEAFKYIVLAVDVLYWIALLFALYCSKFIGIEMMSVLQMSYLAILTLDHRAPAVENLPYLKYSVGINPLFQDIQSYSPIRVLRMGYRSQFMADYNLAVLTFIGCLLVGLGMYIYHIVRKRSDTDQEDLKNKRALNITHVFSDWILVVALFNVYGIVFAFTINILFQPSLNIIDVAFGAVMVLGLIGIAVYYGLKNREFKECMLFFNVAKDVKLARYHPVFMMADRFVYSIIAAAIGQNSYATYVLMVWVLAYTLFVCFKNPY